MKKTREKLYTVYFNVIGEREDGSYLVNTDKAINARKIVKSINKYFVPGDVYLTNNHWKEMEFKNIEEYIGEIKIPEFGKATLIEMGT